MQSGALRQITFEDDPAVSVGAPVWSPNRDAIAFVSSKRLTGLEFGVWLVNPDGSNLRNIAMPGLGMAWSPDGKWLYFADTSAGALKKVEASGGTPVTVRSEPTRNVIGLSGETLYYTVERPLVDGRPEFDIRAATPEAGPSRLLARIPASRVASLADRQSGPVTRRTNGSRCRSPMASRPTSGRSRRGTASGGR